MTRFVVDSGVLLRIARREADVHPDHQLVAPACVRSEALAALYHAVRRGELERRAGLELLERVAEVKIRLLNDRVSRNTAWRIAEQHGIEDVRAAEYAAITQLQGDALVTEESELARLLDGVVPTARIEALGAPERSR